MKLRRFLALALALAMVFSFAACAKGGNSGGKGGKKGDTPLVVGYSPFSSKFSPFFAETAYDQDVSAMTQVTLLTTDRVGNVIMNGIKGETINYNGKDYTYTGIADCKVTQNDDGTVYYDFTLRDDVKFSDGEPLTVDDLIFTMYVYADPTYDGSSTFFALPIEGMDEYRAGMDTLFNLIEAAGRDNADFTNWTKEQQEAFWASYDKANTAMAQEIVDYCVVAGYNTAEDPVSAVAANWGFEIAEDATVEDFAAAIVEAYENSAPTAWATESAGSSFADLFENYADYTVGIKTGESAESIKGIQKTGDNTLRVVLTKVDATAIYQFTMNVTPLHYYGDKAKYDYEKNSFGFTKGDLSSVRAKTTQPMGAGPYKFLKFENGTVSFEANANYFKGAPKTKYVNFLESQDTDKLNGVVTGTIDITDPSFSVDTAKAISKENSNGEITGNKVTTSLVDNLGYGYLGMNAERVLIGNDKASDASKNLRKALATVFAVYRDVTVDSYYGEAASVINYPISNTSWAAPQKTDEGYKVAFSTDASGKDIYTSDMKAEDRYAAALAASLTFFEAAGYTVEDGKVTAAPAGAKTEFEVWIPADGAGDHPSFMMLNLAADAFKTIGITLNVKDLANSSDLWTALQAGQVDMWCAAWGASIDPDMYQIYFSGDNNNKAGGSNYMYKIDDAKLNQLILDARASLDQSYRKTVYKNCLDIIVDWAVEIPVYQRQNAIIFSTERVNIATVTPDITTFYGWMQEIEKIELAK